MKRSAPPSTFFQKRTKAAQDVQWNHNASLFSAAYKQPSKTAKIAAFDLA
jgi:hypothetical protein